MNFYRTEFLVYIHGSNYNVEHHKCGKWIIATKEDQIEQLRKIKKTSLAPLDWVPIHKMNAEGSFLNSVAALESSETGIVDSHQYMAALEGCIKDKGGCISI